MSHRSVRIALTLAAMFIVWTGLITLVWGI